MVSRETAKSSETAAKTHESVENGLDKFWSELKLSWDGLDIVWSDIISAWDSLGKETGACSIPTKPLVDVQFDIFQAICTSVWGVDGSVTILCEQPQHVVLVGNLHLQSSHFRSSNAVIPFLWFKICFPVPIYQFLIIYDHTPQIVPFNLKMQRY